MSAIEASTGAHLRPDRAIKLPRRFLFTTKLDGRFTASATGKAILQIAILDGRRLVARGRTRAGTTICGGMRALTVQVTRRYGGSFRLDVSLP
jgi:hypothetical protein